MARASIALVLAIAGGCAVNEKKEVDQYRVVVDGENAPQARYSQNDRLSLVKALMLANQNNERVGISGENYIQFLADRERIVADFLPTISLVPSWSWTQKPGGTTGGSSGTAIGGTGTGTGGTGTGGTGTGGTGGTGGTTGTGGTSTVVTSGGSGRRNTFTTPMNLRWNLFNGFRDYSALQQADANINNRRALLLDLQSTVLLDTANAYYQVMLNERSVQVLRTNVETQAEGVRLVRGQQAAGVAKPADVSQAEAQEASTRAQLISSETSARNSRTLLAFLTDAPVNDAILTDEMSLPETIPPVETLLREAEGARQDLAAARANIESARHGVQIAFGEYYPTISLNLNYYIQRNGGVAGSYWNSLVSASLPLFTGGLIHADYRIALSQLRQAKLQESMTRRQVEQDVLQAYENLAGNGARLQELVVEVNAAREALRVAKGLYQFGNGLFLDVLTAQDRLLSAELALATEEFNRKTFYLTLLRVSGKLVRPPSGLVTTQPTTQPGLDPTLNGPVTTPTLDAPALPASPDTTQPSTMPVGEPKFSTPPTTAPSEGGTSSITATTAPMLPPPDVRPAAPMLPPPPGATSRP